MAFYYVCGVNRCDDVLANYILLLLFIYLFACFWRYLWRECICFVDQYIELLLYLCLCELIHNNEFSSDQLFYLENWINGFLWHSGFFEFLLRKMLIDVFILYFIVSVHKVGINFITLENIITGFALFEEDMLSEEDTFSSLVFLSYYPPYWVCLLVGLSF